MMAILMALFLTGVALGLIGDNSALFGIGERVICLHNPNITIGTNEGDARTLAMIVKPGVRAGTDGIMACADHPTSQQQVLYAGTQMPSTIFGFVTIFLLWWLVRGARREGPFAAGNPRRVRAVGWWLIIGGMGSAAIDAAAEVALKGTLFRDSGSSWEADLLPWPLLLSGLGMLTVARILAAAAVMREEIEATI